MDERINDMCIGCAKYMNGCKGTTNPVWTGCIYKETEGTKEQAINHLKYGNKGDYVIEGNKKAIRIENGGTVPACNLFENGAFIGECLEFSKTIEWLFS